MGTSMKYQGNLVTAERNAVSGDPGFDSFRLAALAGPHPSDQILITVHGPGDVNSPKVVLRSELSVPENVTSGYAAGNVAPGEPRPRTMAEVLANPFPGRQVVPDTNPVPAPSAETDKAYIANKSPMGAMGTPTNVTSGHVLNANDTAAAPRFVRSPEDFANIKTIV